jgi:hypothetical protein
VDLGGDATDDLVSHAVLVQHANDRAGLSSGTGPVPVEALALTLALAGELFDR